MHNLSQTYTDLDEAAPEAPPAPAAKEGEAKPAEGKADEKDPIANAAMLQKFANDVGELKKATAAATEVVKAGKEAMEIKKKEEDK